MIISLVQMGSKGGQGGGAVSVKMLVLIIGILFILNVIRYAYVILGHLLVRGIIVSALENIPMISWEEVSHREWNFLDFCY